MEETQSVKGKGGGTVSLKQHGLLHLYQFCRQQVVADSRQDAGWTLATITTLLQGAGLELLMWSLVACPLTAEALGRLV